MDKERERWLFLGDSITYEGTYVDVVETWFLLHEQEVLEMIDLGVSSETVSGLSEPDHPFPRPYLHDRLGAVLGRVQPDVVVACYGMNCGIYHPFEESRFAAYQQGIEGLVEACADEGADLILLTPPPYASRVVPRAGPGEGELYSFQRPTLDYNEVLQSYADWLSTLDGNGGVQVFDVRPVMEQFMKESYVKDPIHPKRGGHVLMAEVLLQGLGKSTGFDWETGQPDAVVRSPRWRKVEKWVRRHRELSDRALLHELGHGNVNIRKAWESQALSDLEWSEKMAVLEAERVALFE